MKALKFLGGGNKLLIFLSSKGAVPTYVLYFNSIYIYLYTIVKYGAQSVLSDTMLT